eukprot:8878222-Lingulodinium_polyedra.AAC.1
MHAPLPRPVVEGTGAFGWLRPTGQGSGPPCPCCCRHAVIHAFPHRTMAYIDLLEQQLEWR